MLSGEVEQREVGADSRVPLEDLCRWAVDNNVRQNCVSSTSLSQASVAVSTMETAWRQAQLSQRLSQELTRAELSTQRLQLQLTAHCWLHEDTLAAAQVPLPAPPISKFSYLIHILG